MCGVLYAIDTLVIWYASLGLNELKGLLRKHDEADVWNMYSRPLHVWGFICNGHLIIIFSHLKTEENNGHFADDIFKYILLC